MTRGAIPAVLIAALTLTGCLPPSDQPAWPGRMGRFAGLVANCGCSDVTPDRMIADYPLALGGRYTPDQVRSMRGDVMIGATERWDNQMEICAEVCAQKCMVESVVAPLGGRSTGTAACLVTDRDLHLTDGRFLDLPGGSMQ